MGSSWSRRFGSSRSSSSRTDDGSARGVSVKDQKTLRKKLIEEEERDLEEEERGIFGDESGLQVVDAGAFAPSGFGSDVLHATPLKGMGMKVAGNRVESDLELCRLRVQRWLKELRRLRAKVTRELADEERRGAQGEGPEHQSRAPAIRRADAAAGRNATSAFGAARTTI